MKICTYCKIEKPLSEFNKVNRATGARKARQGLGVDSVCGYCKAEKRSPGIHARREASKTFREDQQKKGLNWCNVCSNWLPFSSFSKRKASVNGLAHTCSICVSKRCKDWREDRPNSFKDWYKDNKQARSQYWKEWYENNKDLRKESYAVWARENKHIVNSLNAKRNAIKFNATPKWANLEAIQQIYRECAQRTLETGIRHEVDHYYPLQGELVCGLHCEDNLRIITKTENIRKKNKMPEAVNE